MEDNQLNTITIVGLGPGAIDDLSYKAWHTLKQASIVYLRTAHHACVSCLPRTDTAYHSFDDLYEQSDDFESVYTAIVEQLLAAARSSDVVYAVPGDPFVGESTTRHISTAAKEQNIQVEIVHGISFIEPMLKIAGIDALDGLQILDGLGIVTMHHPPINPDLPAFVGQIYNHEVASNVKLTLMNQYPDEFEVMLIHAASTDEVQIERLPLYEIDLSNTINHMTSLYLPAMEGMNSFERFQEIIAHLRAPEGCPWDQKQTHESLRQYLLEETYEVLETIETGNIGELAGELGDLMLQVVLHTQIAIDDGEFYMTDVLRSINAKMIRRHPHVFGKIEVDDADEVMVNWEAIKKQEKVANGKPENDSILASIPKGLPALQQAYQYQKRAAKVGFDWADIRDVRAKITEEIDELLAVLDDPEELAKETGDLLFALVNWLRWLKVEPETVLREANARFARRFHYVEQRTTSSDKPMIDHTLEELDSFWNEAKANGL